MKAAHAAVLQLSAFLQLFYVMVNISWAVQGYCLSFASHLLQYIYQSLLCQVNPGRTWDLLHQNLPQSLTPAAQHHVQSSGGGVGGGEVITNQT
jgi:hypothetical protein